MFASRYRESFGGDRRLAEADLACDDAGTSSRQLSGSLRSASNSNSACSTLSSLFIRLFSVFPVVVLGLLAPLCAIAAPENDDARGAVLRESFEKSIGSLVQTYCSRCHNAEEMESGIRVDHLNGRLDDRNLRLWGAIQELVAGEVMPPSDEPQPTDEQRQILNDWIDEALAFARSREGEKNGSARRLTVTQYRDTLRDFLGIEDDLTDVLPPDGISKDGFANNGRTLLLSPLLVERYFEIAETALDLCLVDEDSKPVIQNFRVDLGAKVNPDPYPDELILGANSKLLGNDQLLVTQLVAKKPFEFEPFMMRTKYRFIEGYEGNDTVRGWREFDSIYHAVFVGMRGSDGYPKGLAHEGVKEGLLLRPAIPSAEVFQVESTYGPRANLKLSMRELPEAGRFRVTVRAAKYNDGLLLEERFEPRPDGEAGALTIHDPQEMQTVNVESGGVYQVDAYLKEPTGSLVPPDDSKLTEELIGNWRLDGELRAERGTGIEGDASPGRLEGDAKFVDSPFGKALSLDGETGAVIVPRDDSMSVGTGAFTVTAWIHPRELRQAGLVTLGAYGYTHGWVFDMPDGGGALRLETAKKGNMRNGSVMSRAGVVRAGQWQHVAAVIERGHRKARLYVNASLVGDGTIRPEDLDNPDMDLHIGRVPGADFFAGEIDEVRIYRRVLGVAELEALIEPGRAFVKPPPEGRKNLRLDLAGRRFSGILHRSAFLGVRLFGGPLTVRVSYDGNLVVDRVVLTPISDLDDDSSRRIVERLTRLENRSPRVGVHVGIRRDCGSTFKPAGTPQTVSSFELKDFVFEGAINNFPRPEVEKDNVNYLAGIREIAVRSEYTDGREMPRLVVRSIEFEGPLYESWPPATHRNIFVDSENREDLPTYAREVIRSFASRAFRRPASRSEVDSLFSVWEDSFVETGDFQASVKNALVVVLTSPQFLFIIEKSDTPEAEPLDSYELASKLSYFLWNTSPDERLLDLAAQGELQTSLDGELDRMVKDPRFKRFANEFASQWLSLDKLDVVEVDHNDFPKLTRDRKAALRQEPVEFVSYLIRQNLPARNLVKSDFIVVNEPVADYYGLGDRTESGFEFVSIKHGSDSLGGVLSQAGILAGLSDGRHSNPIKRGAWLARKIIAEPPDDPPPNVPELPVDDSGKLSLQEKLELHRDQKGCANCHSGIDPWGIPLEQFDAGGLRKKSEAIDVRSTLPDGTDVTDTNALKSYLANERIDQVAFSFVKHVAVYANGRGLSYNEIDLLKEKVVELRADGYRLKDLIRFVVKSPLFTEK